MSKQYLNTDFDPRNVKEYNVMPYMQGSNEEPMTYSNPLIGYLQNPSANDTTDDTMGYKRGGVARMRQQLKRAVKAGRGGDTMLAHINPLEASILKGIGGSGTINPKTGLPEFGFFNKPGKALKSIIGGGAGTILGNMLLPGIGGIIGGALGQGVQEKIRGKKLLPGIIKGALIGGSLPSIASLAGSGANALRMNTIGSTLSDYGTKNAIISSLGLGAGAEAGAEAAADTITREVAKDVAKNTAKKAAEESFFSKLKDYVTEPKNLIPIGTLALSAYNSMPKKEKKAHEDSPEEQADKKFRYNAALNNKTLAYFAQKDAEKGGGNYQDNSGARKKRARVVGDEVIYEDEPLVFKKGGLVFERMLLGSSGGQDDKIPALLSDGEYVIDASTVSDIGDGNTLAGIKKLDLMRSKIRKEKRGGKVGLPPKAKNLIDYIK